LRSIRCLKRKPVDVVVSQIFNEEEMMKEEKEVRRSFLKHILAGSAVVATALAGKKSAEAKIAETLQPGDEVLYKETEDFKKYYKSIRS